MKLLFDYQAFNNQKYGGVSRSMLFLIEELKKQKKLSVSLICIFSFNYYLINKSLILSFIDSYFFQLSKYLKKKGRLISRYWVNFKLLYFPPDIFIPTYYDSFFLNSICNTPLVVTIHDMIHELYLFNSEYSAKIIKQKKSLLFASTSIIAISHNTKKDILSIYPSIPEDKISVIYWGNPMQKFKNIHINIQKKKQLIYVGDREGYKNFIWLVNAISDWLIYNDFNLLCVGGNSFSSNELENFSNLNISNRLYQKNLNDYDLSIAYAESFTLLVPSLYEGFCFPVIEAMSLGCPVVYANNSCLPEIASFAGVSYIQNDIRHLNECLELLLNDNNNYNNIIELGITHSNNFTWSKCANETQIVYEKCLF